MYCIPKAKLEYLNNSMVLRTISSYRLVHFLLKLLDRFCMLRSSCEAGISNARGYEASGADLVQCRKVEFYGVPRYECKAVLPAVSFLPMDASAHVLLRICISWVATKFRRGGLANVPHSTSLCFVYVRHASNESCMPWVVRFLCLAMSKHICQFSSSSFISWWSVHLTGHR